MNEMKSRLRTLRLLQAAFIAVIPIVACITEILFDRGNSEWTWRHSLAVGLALWSALAGFRLRRRLLHRSESPLADDPSNPKALRQWQAGQIIGMAFAESIVWWGLTLRMVFGGTFWQAALFYATGLFLLLLWTPRAIAGFSD
ncbi:MAG: hypothetical protein ABSD53_21325 [Terriglobales bacterium]|jgi:membrane protein implicated in regulation of membrane protease activity